MGARLSSAGSGERAGDDIVVGWRGSDDMFGKGHGGCLGRCGGLAGKRCCEFGG